jgi:hypothetical protein
MIARKTLLKTISFSGAQTLMQTEHRSPYGLTPNVYRTIMDRTGNRLHQAGDPNIVAAPVIVSNGCVYDWRSDEG